MTGPNVTPQNEEAELAAIGSLILEPERIADCSLESCHFYDDRNRKLFAVLADLHERGEPVNDPLVITDELTQRGQLENVTALHVAQALDCVPHARNLEYYVGQVLNEYRRRAVLNIGRRLESHAYDKSVDISASVRTALTNLERIASVAEQSDRWELNSVWSAIDHPTPMREPVIEGLCRRGEVMNVIASTKTHKSWLATHLAFCVASGTPWLGRQTRQGRVLLLDNELHRETIENRCSAVATAGGFVHTGSDFDYVDLRGKNVGIEDLKRQLSFFKPGELTLVILDAKYRFFGSGTQENSNDDQTAFHNAVDNLANELDCVIVLIHHATKGDQGGKSVTDVGSGGGAQSRAADCHLVLRPHDDSEDLAVLDAALRTFPKMEPQTIRWEFPMWHAEASVEPVVKQPPTRGDSRKAAKDDKAVSDLANVFHEHRGDPLARYELRKELGWGFDRLNRVLRLSIERGVVEKAGTRPGKKKGDDEIDVFILAADYEFHSEQDVDLSGIFSQAVSS